MQSLFPRSTSLFKAVACDWRLGAIVLTALVASQGCGTIADGPHRALSTTGVASAESQPNSLASDKPAIPVHRSETPPIANVPLPPETERAADVARLPAPTPPNLTSPQISTETGVASWYGAKHHGRRTASGEVFNQEHLTAAHPTLPWGSRVKVINLDNGNSVYVRVNDRGPFKKGRIIDVSRAAARALDMLQRGLATVRIEWVADSQQTNELVLQGR